MRTPRTDWTTYIYRNEVGSYRRDFDIPSNWDGKEVYINFDGVDSFFYLWINGKYVGFSKNSRNVASFNITPYLNKKGKNSVSVEVYRNSDASFIEAQDMFRLPGIFRTVSLTAKPKVQIRDIRVIPDLDKNYENGVLQIEADILNLDKKDISDYKIAYSLYANKLYSDVVTTIDGQPFLMTDNIKVSKGQLASFAGNLSVKSPNKWSAEAPYRYTLVAELKDKKGRIVETVSTHVGFRKVEVKETRAEDDEFGLAGRYFYVNGKTVKLKGVNRHETNPETGKVVSHAQMEKEIFLMKRANINHVRNSHYPDDPYWYYLCDKYGIYLEDEANIESHEYYYGDASLSHPVEWRDAHVARNLEMVHATINHPSIVIWSLGNEAGPGQNFVEAYNAIKKLDTSRPVQYERNNSIVDIGSNQYPSIQWVRGAVQGNYKLKYPFHISEYAHSMGNASGNLIDYWEAIESTNFFMGGALWDWIDQSMYYYDKVTGERFLAYGGDFGDKPNDGTFVNNGLIFADLQPKPQYFEVKKVYQNVGVKAIDIQKGKIEIFNKNYFTGLDDYELQWSLYEDGVEIVRNTFSVPGGVTARERKEVTIPLDFNTLKKQSEYFIKIQFVQKNDKPWTPTGYIQMEEQLLVKQAEARPSVASLQPDIPMTVSDEANLKIVEGKDFKVKFDLRTGTIFNLVYHGETIIRDGEGPKLDALRAPLDNDNWAYQQWFEKGLHNLKHRALSKTIYHREDGAVVLSFVVESQAPNGASIRGGTSGTYTIVEHEDRPFGLNDFKFTTNQVWTVYADGTIELASTIVSNDQSFNLARIGYGLQLPQRFENYHYYGRGPINNYADRKTAQNIELHKSTVKDQFVPWPSPQSMSNNEDIRYSALTDNQGNGLVFIARDFMSTSALPWSELEVTLASHPYQLPESSGTHLHLDAAVTGLGGNSCGQGPPLEEDRVKAEPTMFGFIIRPVTANDYRNKAQVEAAGDVPLAITRSRTGEISVLSQDSDAVLYYAVNNGAVKVYDKPFNLREGGQVIAWDKNNDKLKATLSFEKIETVPLIVVSASSQETGERAANLVDGNPSSIWHTMYSVTVAQYPHWVDFDAGEVQQIKGFTYLPRPSGSNGDIKDYRLQVSLDGQQWQDVTEGTFENTGKKLRTVLFDSLVKGRFVRFTALSSRDGQDFASGAEFNILVD
jgi:beta-galactosidase